MPRTFHARLVGLRSRHLASRPHPRPVRRLRHHPRRRPPTWAATPSASTSTKPPTACRRPPRTRHRRHSTHRPLARTPTGTPCPARGWRRLHPLGPHDGNRRERTLWHWRSPPTTDQGGNPPDHVQPQPPPPTPRTPRPATPSPDKAPSYDHHLAPPRSLAWQRRRPPQRPLLRPRRRTPQRRRHPKNPPTPKPAPLHQLPRPTPMPPTSTTHLARRQPRRASGSSLAKPHANSATSTNPTTKAA